MHFGLNGKEELVFGFSLMTRNRGSCLYPDCNGFEWKKSVLARLELLGMEELGFSPIKTAWNRRNVP
jgi:hypothetical protein